MAALSSQLLAVRNRCTAAISRSFAVAMTLVARALSGGRALLTTLAFCFDLPLLLASPLRRRCFLSGGVGAEASAEASAAAAVAVVAVVAPAPAPPPAPPPPAAGFGLAAAAASGSLPRSNAVSFRMTRF